MRGVSVLRGAVRAVRPRSPGTPTYLQNPAPELGESRSHHSTVMRVFEGEVFLGWTSRYHYYSMLQFVIVYSHKLSYTIVNYDEKYIIVQYGSI